MNLLQPSFILFISQRDLYTSSTRENNLLGGPYSANQYSALAKLLDKTLLSSVCSQKRQSGPVEEMP